MSVTAKRKVSHRIVAEKMVARDHRDDGCNHQDGPCKRFEEDVDEAQAYISSSSETMGDIEQELAAIESEIDKELGLVRQDDQSGEQRSAA